METRYHISYIENDCHGDPCYELWFEGVQCPHHVVIRGSYDRCMKSFQHAVRLAETYNKEIPYLVSE